MRTETITSAQNSKVKLLLELQEKSKARKKEGLFVVEGRRELLHFIEAGYVPHTVFFCPEIISENDKAEIVQAIKKQNAEGNEKMPMAIEVPQQLYDKVAYRGGTEGVVAEMYCKDLNLESLKLKENPLIVVLLCAGSHKRHRERVLPLVSALHRRCSPEEMPDTNFFERMKA